MRKFAESFGTDKTLTGALHVSVVTESFFKHTIRSLSPNKWYREIMQISPFTTLLPH